MQSRGSRKYTIHLTPGSIGVKAEQRELIDLAHHYGYEAVEPQPAYLATLKDDEIKALTEYLQARQLVWGAAGLTVEFRQTDEMFNEGMKKLPAQAAALRKAGVTRVGTWMRPSHDTWTYRQHFDIYTRRLGAVADVLGGQGLRLGLEYVGPKLNWSAMRHPFIHTMAETKELIAAMGKKNVGFVLDSWHWYTAGEGKADLLTLRNADVVSVDLNDAPLGRKVEEQIDSQRELPAATGVIDIATFLNALQAIGYDGPIRPEPFNAPLRAMPREQILTVTVEAMRKAFGMAGAG